LFDRIMMCSLRTQETGEAHCMALEGCSGAGKTTLAKTIAFSVDRTEEDFGTKIPVLYIQTPSPVSVKGMAAKMLEELGDKAPDKGQLWGMNSRIVRYIKVCKVELVILDDIQHLIDHRDRALDEVSDWLKVLIKETNVPFLIIGLEGKVKLILDANEQLSRLFSSRESLKPFDISNSDGRKEYNQFISYVLQNRKVQVDDSIQIPDLLKRIHFVTKGVVAHTVNLLNDAAYLADEREASIIESRDLSDAFTRRFGYTNLVNPFDFSEKFNPQKAKKAPPSIGLTKKGKIPTQRASDVLSK
jgi:energy-coupling factor transporter ATP-binding protein EcfA2